jgi:3-deoxy-D-manno-octulosonic-acid transferase
LLLYRALSSLALAVYAPYALLRSVAGGRRLGDVRGRLGQADYPGLDGGIWIHAVSVGEIGVARNLLAALRQAAPELRIGVSVTTEAGRELASRTLSGQAPVFPFPFDLAGPVEKALDRVRPAAVLLTETELWPLFLERAERRGIRVALVNGRISTRSFGRYRLVRGWFARTLRRVALFAMQSPEDARRIEALGAPPDRVCVLGNVKYDLPRAQPFPDAGRLREAAGGRPVLVAGSTREGEEEIVLDALSRLPDRPLLVLAPRRPERFDAVAEEVGRRGLRLLRRSSQPAQGALPRPDAYLLDSIGELASSYGEATIAFVGGSLLPYGGQNPIEAWAAGVPVVSGPHMENFRDVAAAGEAGGFLERASDAVSLSRSLARALGDPAGTAHRGAIAAGFVASSRGAAERTAAAVLALVRHAADGPGSAG